MIIHQIWLGSNKRPDIWMDNVKTFCEKYLHTYMLWTEDNLIELKNKKYYDIMTAYCGKADIVRYELLYKYGGLYIDADMVIVNEERFNMIITKFENSEYDILIGKEPDTRYIANSIMFARANCSFLKKVISAIPYRDFTKNVYKITGPCLITDIYNDISRRSKKKVKVYDSNVFFPEGWKKKRNVTEHTKINFNPESVTFQYGYSTNGLADLIT